jgi:carboxypeptidase Taq
VSQAAFDELRRRLAEVSDLGRISALLSWDQQVLLPPRGAPNRAEQRATLARVIHEKYTDPEIGRLVDQLRGWGEEQPYDSLEASLIRVTARDWDKARRVPADLRADMTRAASLGNTAWVEARKNNDFASFMPVLQTNIDLKRRYVECFDPADEPYDILLDDFEPLMKTATVRRLFDYLKEHQAPLVKEVAGRSDPERPAGRNYPIEGQKRFELEVARAFGFTDDAWRLDPTVHPFATGTGIQDIRVTTRYFPSHLDGLFSTMHEFGHGLYEHQVDEGLERTPLARGVSLGVHESQSRMWENLVGRSLPFWRGFFPRLQETFPDALGGLDTDAWYQEINAVRPSLIRVEADEATYNLHIILRFELEQELLAGSFPLKQLPEEWNRRMWEYLGIEVPDDTRGVLQDTHWGAGSIGYFSTYALGNLISAQIWEKLTADVPDLAESVEAGEFASLRDWLRENLHRYGRKFTPAETLQRVVGTPEIDPAPYVRYLREKLAGLYGIPATA